MRMIRYACPECGDTRILVQFTGTCEITADGSTDVGSHEYDQTSPAQCVACDYSAALSAFQHEVEEP